MKKNGFVAVLFFFLCICVNAQSSEKLAELIDSECASFGQVAYLVGVYSNKIDEKADYNIAIENFNKSGYILRKVNVDDKVLLGDLSLIVAKVGNMKGGLFYSIFKNSRYAFKELKALGILPEEADPSMLVSGRDVLAIFSSVVYENDGE